ncbi:MAG: amidohydrolase family protein [Acidimicrobiia bacterium]|nr:amidohydrolase family protein [Acidimicrobiia bacterium]
MASRSRVILGVAMVGLLSVLAVMLAAGDREERTTAAGQSADAPASSRRPARGAAIDVHTHVISQALADGLTGGGVPGSTAEDLLERLDEANVDKAVVLSLGYFDLPDDSNMAPENDFTASIVAEAPDRLIGFCGINPGYDSAVSEIDRCLALPEMVGIKLNIVGGSGLDWENAEHAAAISAVLDSAGRHDAPVLMHVAAAPLDDDSLLSALAVIGSHPDVRLVIAHCGGDADYEIEQYLIPAAATPPLISLDNLYTDVSSCLSFYRDAPRSQRELIVWRLRKWGIERVFFGSDYLSIAPAETPREALDTLARYPFTDREIRTILSNDASAWLVGT